MGVLTGVKFDRGKLMKRYILTLLILLTPLMTGWCEDGFIPSNTRSGVFSNDGSDRQQAGQGRTSFDPAAAAQGKWFMSREREAYFRGLLPRTSDEDINAVLTNPDLILYTDREIPLARQNWSGASSGIHSINYDLSGGADRFGRGSAHEFPWADPAGTHLVPERELVEVRGMLLPKQNGRFLPIAYWQTRQDVARGMYDAGRQKIEWTYPHGTVFVELLARKLSNGNTVPFELRVRERERGEWSVDVFRPFIHWRDMQTAVAAIGYEDESQRLVMRPVIRDATLRDSIHTGEKEIDLTAQVEQLPTYSDVLVAALLKDRTFESALGESWRYDREKDIDVAAPAGGVYPTNYRAVMEVDRESCMNCHRSTNRHVSHFQLRRDWYGNVRGSDYILSFHIFDPSCISTNGMNLPVAYRRELRRWGILEPYDRRSHTASRYTALND